MATTEPGISTPASPSDVGRQLRSVRKARGLSRAEVARSAGLTRRELAAYERGKTPVPESDLWCLAGSCGVDVRELLPPGDRLTVGSDLGALTVGESVARLRVGAGGDAGLREYLSMVYELRNLPPGAKPPMRAEDLATLAEALGGSPEAIEARLHELIGASREEAARLRSMILPPRPISAPLATPVAPVAAPLAAPSAPRAVPAAVGAAGPGLSEVPTPPEPVALAELPPPVYAASPPTELPPLATDPPAPAFTGPGTGGESALPSYPPPAFDFAPAAPTIGDPDAADRFFSAPQADDPFAPPPPLGAFAPPTGSFDPFAPPSGPPLAAEAPAGLETDPFGLPTSTPPPRPDGFVVDLGTEVPDLDEPPFASFGDPAGDPFAAPSEMTGTGREAMEMVVLDVEPAATTLDAVGETDAAGAADTDDDPFAVLRVPLDDDPVPMLGDADSDQFADPFVDAFVDPFADSAAFVVPEVVDAPGVGVLGVVDADGEPTDDWFDRAAAAADALIAGQRADDTPDRTDDAVAAALDAADTAESCEDTLAPIMWSLTPPVTTSDTSDTGDTGDVGAVEHTPEGPPSTEFVAAGPDWEVGGIFPATAMADDGTLALRRADVRWALADVSASGDFTARAHVNFTSGAGFGILFRTSTDASERITGYSFDVDPIYSGGGFLLRQWNDSRQHWKPLAHTPATDTARLYGAHVIEVSLRNDVLVASIDGEMVMEVPQLSRRSVDAGHAPCRGGRIGVQAWSTTEVTVDRLLVAQH